MWCQTNCSYAHVDTVQMHGSHLKLSLYTQSKVHGKTPPKNKKLRNTLNVRSSIRYAHVMQVIEDVSWFYAHVHVHDTTQFACMHMCILYKWTVIRAFLSFTFFAVFHWTWPYTHIYIHTRISCLIFSVCW